MVGDALGGYSVALQVEQVDGVEASGKGLQDGNAIDDEKVNNEWQLGSTTINNEVGNHGNAIGGREVEELDSTGKVSTKVFKGRQVLKKN